MEAIFFYDGDCGFCNRMVLYLLDRTSERLKFCPLQSDYAKQKLLKFQIEKIDFSTAYFLLDGKLYQQSAAILEACGCINQRYEFLKRVAYIFPTKFRDYIYNKFSENRLRMAQNCRLLNSDERKRFIGT